MTDDHDALESELAALRPREVSPGLRQRISDRLAKPQPWRSRRTWWIAATGAALAAGIAALLLIRVDWSAQREPDGRPRPPDSSVVNVPSPSPEPADTLPTLLTYSRALARSPEELEALLDRHGRLGSPARPEELPVAFTRPADPLHPLLGEL